MESMIDSLQKKVQALQEEVRNLKEKLYASQRIRYQLDRRIQDESSKCTKSYNALKFYADSNNYRAVINSVGQKNIAINQDFGKTARHVLHQR